MSKTPQKLSTSGEIAQRLAELLQEREAQERRVQRLGIFAEKVTPRPAPADPKGQTDRDAINAGMNKRFEQSVSMTNKS